MEKNKTPTSAEEVVKYFSAAANERPLLTLSEQYLEKTLKNLGLRTRSIAKNMKDDSYGVIDSLGKDGETTKAAVALIASALSSYQAILKNKDSIIKERAFPENLNKENTDALMLTDKEIIRQIIKDLVLELLGDKISIDDKKHSTNDMQLTDLYQPGTVTDLHKSASIDELSGDETFKGLKLPEIIAKALLDDNAKGTRLHNLVGGVNITTESGESVQIKNLINAIKPLADVIEANKEFTPLFRQLGIIEAPGQARGQG